jgi:hypothetical protein
MKERKCSDYFIFYSRGNRHYCRLSEWKSKKGVCPYDKAIVSNAYLKRGKKNKKLEDFKNAKISCFCE